MTRRLEVLLGLIVSTNTRPALGARLSHGHGHVHTCGMEISELTAVALTVVPLPPPPPLRRAEATTLARLA
jgi:hypothetical protein